VMFLSYLAVNIHPLTFFGTSWFRSIRWLNGWRQTLSIRLTLTLILSINFLIQPSIFDWYHFPYPPPSTGQAKPLKRNESIVKGVLVWWAKQRHQKSN
jgi:hypothetical protein